MVGLGSPQFDKQNVSDVVKDEKIAQLEARLEKLEKTLTWIKWGLIILAFLYLTNNKKNEN
jgi:hypothetical protein